MINKKENEKKQTVLSQIQSAKTYTEWLSAQSEWEALSRIHQWSESSEDEPNYPYASVKAHQEQLETALKNKDTVSLISNLTEGLYRLLNEISEPELYTISALGSKHLTVKYFNTISKCIDYLCQDPTLPHQAKINLLKTAKKNLGAPALMLSGGGTFGLYHMGVIKALHEHKLIPEIICGTSMGSIAAGILATHNDDELSALFLKTHEQDYAPLKKLALNDVAKQKCLLDSKRLYDCIESNTGDVTFAEAYKHSGRTVSITVSPTRQSQKPRILNHLTSPTALIAFASKASCSVPGLFPPVQLQQRTQSKQSAYCSDELWIDGSFATDIPRQRMSRLFNVNFFIVSQANPHILPFVKSKQKKGLLPSLQDVLTETFLAQSLAVLNVLRRRNKQAFFRSWIDQCASMIDQDYQGDINIHPAFPLKWFRKFMINPSQDELDYLILMGERVTWPKIAQINEQTKLHRKLSESLRLLENKTLSSIHKKEAAFI
jgi:TAG lipase/steryl ester hydrolase/phospholipase A2/LPA acyltransferase